MQDGGEVDKAECHERRPPQGGQDGGGGQVELQAREGLDEEAEELLWFCLCVCV